MGAIFCVSVAFLSRTPFGENMLSKAKWLRVKSLDVHCEWPLTPAEVKSWLPPVEGVNIISVRATKLIEIISAKPWVKSVALRKEYPDRISLHIGSKIPRAISLLHQQPHFVDENGHIIEKASTRLLKNLDLPFISVDASATAWDIAKVLTTLEAIKARLGEKREISQVWLGTYPIFKIYLLRPKLEVVLSEDTWTTQMPSLMSLLDNPPSQIGQLQRINLVFPKKAIVSSLNQK